MPIAAPIIPSRQSSSSTIPMGYALLAGLLIWRFSPLLLLLTVSHTVTTPLSAIQPSFEMIVGREEKAILQMVSLDQCIEIALCQNPTAVAARYGVVAEREAVGIAHAPYYPTIATSASYYHFQKHIFFPSSPLFTGVPTIVGPTNDCQYSIEANYILFDSGRTLAGWRAALAELQATDERRKAIEARIVLQLHSTLYNLVAAHKILEIAQESEKSATRHLKISQHLHEEGSVPYADVLRAQVALSLESQRITQAKSRITIAEGEFCLVLGVKPGLNIKIILEEPPLIDPAKDSIEKAMKAALCRRHELHAVEAEVKAACEQLRSELSSFGPRIEAAAKYGRHDANFPAHDKEWLYGLAIDLPLFEGFSRHHRVKKARALLAQIRSQLHENQLLIQKEVWVAFTNLTESYKLLATVETKIKESKEALRLMEERYAAKADILTSLLDAQSSLTKSEAELVQATWSYHLNRAHFLFAQGDLTFQSM